MSTTASYSGCSWTREWVGEGGFVQESTSELERIRREIVSAPENAWAAAMGYEPLYVADAAARIVVVGQAPGRKAQESGIPWNDASGVRLIDWLGVDEATFRDPSCFAILPM